MEFKEILLPQPKNQNELETTRALQELMTNLKTILNGGILFSDNFDMDMTEFTADAVADAENTIAHGLGKIPSGYIVYYQDAAGSLYDSGTSWTSTNIYLKSSVADVTYKILVF